MFFPLLRVEGTRQGSLDYPGYKEGERKGLNTFPIPHERSGPSKQALEGNVAPQNSGIRMHHETPGRNSLEDDCF